MTLWNICNKILFFEIFVITILAGFLTWMFCFKIEMTIKALLKNENFETKLVVEPKFINHIVKKQVIYLKIKHKKIETEIKKVFFNVDKNYYELETNYFWNQKVNSTLEVEIIYRYLQLSSFIFNAYSVSFF